MNRDAMLERIRAGAGEWDLVIVGGGATGVGTAVDAASRGYRVLLLEQSDFGKGTSTRSTKLVHGGVRYLQQGNLSLVMEALEERGILRRNAAHLVHDLEFVVPNYAWWEAPFYGIGMRVYDVLAGKHGFGRSANISAEEVASRIPNIETEGLRGGVVYHDGQFDDARLLVNLVTTAAEQGAVLANYVEVTDLRKDVGGFVDGVYAREMETGEVFEIAAKCVVNATGPFADALRILDDPAAQPLIAPSQGVHLVLDASFLRGTSAIMVPRTEDKRVLFVIPWQNRALVGTTDTPIDEVTLEPQPREEEIAFLLRTAGRYLTRDPTPDDVLSVFTGIRPLVRAAAEGTRTAELSREHTIEISASGLLTIAGGKWTTYRKMAEDVVNHVATLADLVDRPCVTTSLTLHGYHEQPQVFGDLQMYGSDAVEIQALIASDLHNGARLHARFHHCVGEVVWAIRHEMARTVDDVLARRLRILVHDAEAAVEAAPRVAAIFGQELGYDVSWQREQVASFATLAARHLVPPEVES